MTQSKKSAPAPKAKAKPPAAKKTATQAPTKASTASSGRKSLTLVSSDAETFAREYWTGDSRDGVLVNGDGYHYYRMTKEGKILEAYEYYETEDGREFVSPLPEMLNIHWIDDLGFEDFEALDTIKEFDFQRIKEISAAGSAG